MADAEIQSRYVKLNKDQAPVDINPGELNQPIEVPQMNVRKCSECGQALPESFEPPAVEPWSTGIFGCAEDTESCWTGLFCPCVLFGRNYEKLREDMPWTTPCVCHAVFVEGGMALAAATAAFHGIEPQTSVLICEGLLFTWWVCGIYTGIVRQTLQKKYHLKVLTFPNVLGHCVSAVWVSSGVAGKITIFFDMQNSPCDPCLVHCCMHWCALCQEHREMKGRLSDNAIMPMTIVNAPPVQVMDTDGEKKESANGHDHRAHLEMQAL